MQTQEQAEPKPEVPSYGAQTQDDTELKPRYRHSLGMPMDPTPDGDKGRTLVQQNCHADPTKADITHEHWKHRKHRKSALGESTGSNGSTGREQRQMREIEAEETNVDTTHEYWKKTLEAMGESTGGTSRLRLNDLQHCTICHHDANTGVSRAQPGGNLRWRHGKNSSPPNPSCRSDERKHNT